MEKTLRNQIIDLSSAALLAGISAEKIKVLSDELCQRYFDKPDISASSNPNGAALFVLEEYCRYAVFANVIFDYSIQLSKEITVLEKTLSELIEKKVATA